MLNWTYNHLSSQLNLGLRLAILNASACMHALIMSSVVVSILFDALVFLFLCVIWSPLVIINPIRLNPLSGQRFRWFIEFSQTSIASQFWGVNYQPLFELKLKSYASTKSEIDGRNDKPKDKPIYIYDWCWITISSFSLEFLTFYGSVNKLAG